MANSTPQKTRDDSRTRGKVAEKRRNVRRRLMTHGSHLFAARGLANVSVADILGEVNISRRTFYGHFENKYELAAAAINEVLIDGAQIAGKELGQAHDAWLPCIVDCYLQLWAAHRNSLAIISELNPAVMPYIEASHREFGVLLKKLIKNAQTNGELRNGDAGYTFSVITKTAIPLLKVYAEHPQGPRVYRDSMLALLGTQQKE